MKIAITSQGDNAEALIDERFGRCAYFAVFDTESQNMEFVVNPAMNAAGGAGPAAATFLANRGVKKVVSGHFGFKAKAMLDDLHIQTDICSGGKTIHQIINSFNN